MMILIMILGYVSAFIAGWRFCRSHYGFNVKITPDKNATRPVKVLFDPPLEPVFKRWEETHNMILSLDYRENLQVQEFIKQLPKQE